MKKLFPVVLIFLVFPALGQTERSRFDPIMESFHRNFNQGNYDSIFYYFSSSMQQHLPLDKSREFFKNLKSQAGEILEIQTTKIQSNQSTHKMTFEKVVFALDLSLDSDIKINGLLIKPYLADDLPVLQRNVSDFILPFKGAWTVTWGGDTEEQNYHVESKAQKNAFDFLVVGEDGKTFKTDGGSNEDYYAFGKQILAPCDGEVVLVVNGIKDNVPGEMNPIYIPGNTVILKSPQNEFLFFAHFKQHTIKVREGDRVTKGQLLGQCGNSGNSSEPHLHFHLQNVEDMNKATGAKTFFEKALVNGEVKTDYSPVKGDVVQSVEK